MGDAELKKGSAETLILALLSEGALHGYGIAKRIEEKSDGVLQFHVTSLYPILYRLEKEGLLKSDWQQPEGGRRRRYYELTSDGDEPCCVSAAPTGARSPTPSRESSSRPEDARPIRPTHVLRAPDWRSIVGKRLATLVRTEAFPGGGQRLDEIVEELAQHLEDEYAEALRAGLSPADAEREVLRRKAEWSGLARAISSPLSRRSPEPIGDGRGESVAQDIRFALRTLAARPLFTVSIIFLLAMGIGANTALFTVVNSVLFQPLPYHEPERLLAVSEANRRVGGELEASNMKAANLRDLREGIVALDDISGYWQGPATITGQEEPELIAVIRATNNFFSVLGTEASMGATFPSEQSEAAYTAVLDHGFWVRKFASDPQIVGSDITLDKESYTIVGVLPESFRFLERADAYIVGPKLVPAPPVSFTEDYESDRSSGYMKGVGRIEPGVTLDQALADLDRIGRALEAEYPEDLAGRTFTGVPLQDSLVGSVEAALFLLLGAVGLVLLIACANVANLLLARASGRRKEMAVRTALGANRGRVVRQLLTESMMLAGAGGLVGVGVSVLAMDALRALIPDSLPRAAEIGADATVLGFTVTISLLTGLLFGLAPALQSAGTDAQTVIRSDARGASAGRSSARLRDGLVVAEIALALVLLIGAGLTLRSLVALQSQAPGFDPDRVLTLRLALPQAKYDSDEKISALYRRLVDEIRPLPGVESAAITLMVPFSGGNANFTYAVYGEAPPPPGQEYDASFQAVSPGYFETLGIPLLAGRDFTRADSADGQAVVIINDVVAQRHFAGVDPTTRSLAFDSGPDGEALPIVGVVGSTRHHGYESDFAPEVYLSFEQMTFPFTSMVVRARGDAEAIAGSVRAKVLEIDPDQPVYRVQALDALMADTVAQPRFNAQLLGGFAGVALLLAAVGVFGVISYSVSQRTRELGVRMALGASSATVLKMVFRQGLVLVALGLAIGLAAALMISRLVESLWFGIGAADPLVFVAVPTILAVVSLLASYLPARRATRVNPVTALRSD